MTSGGASVDIVLVLGAFAGMLVAFYKIIGSKDTQSAKDREADRAERQALTEAIKLMAESSTKVAVATVNSAREAKQRNGHLGEQNVQIAKLVKNQNDDVANIKKTNKKIADILSRSALIAAKDKEALLIGGEQHIDYQTVEHQEFNINSAPN